MNESSKNYNDAFEKWFEVSNEIDSFNEYFFGKNSFKFEWAKKKTFFWLTKQHLIGFVVGITASLLATYIWNVIILG